MLVRLITRMLGATLLFAIVLSLGTAFASGNSVPPSGAGVAEHAVTVNDLAPSACGSLDLTNVVADSGVFDGTGANDLILGSSGADVINDAPTLLSNTVGGGDDCILGGAGNDTINGGMGDDVCIGGPGTDTFLNCETEIQ